MISLTTPAAMTCDEPTCERSTPVVLILLGTGTFGAKPRDAGWQVALPRGPAGQYVCRCPKHASDVVAPSPAETRHVNGGH